MSSNVSKDDGRGRNPIARDGESALDILFQDCPEHSEDHTAKNEQKEAAMAQLAPVPAFLKVNAPTHGWGTWTAHQASADTFGELVVHPSLRGIEMRGVEVVMC